jgi:hypothetical protein
MAKTKAELEKENFDLRAELRAADEPAPENFEPKAELIHDPYDSHNALSILKEIEPNVEFPAGQVLAWKSPYYRATRGWRGWIPLQWGDEYTGENGEKLVDLIAEIPHRMAEQERQDSYVRRGDVILCRLDKNIFTARQQKRVDKSNSLRGKTGADMDVPNMPNAQIVGDGLTRSERGRFPKE